MNNLNSDTAHTQTLLDGFGSFLEQFIVKNKKDAFTHIAKDPRYSLYIYDPEDQKRFMDEYSELVYRGVVLSLAENPREIGPLRIDFDFKYDIDDMAAVDDLDQPRYYTKDMIKDVVGLYQSLLSNSAEITDDKQLWCLVLEKPHPRIENGVVHDGFHIHFPHFWVEKWFQDEYLRIKVSAGMQNSGMWSGTPFEENVDKLIDSGIASKTWFLYGSAKAQNMDPYLSSFAINHNLEEITLNELFADEMEGRIEDVLFYLPAFLSIRSLAELTPLKQDVAGRKSVYDKRPQRSRAIRRTRTEESIQEDIKLLKDGKILDMLSKERCDDRNTWMEVGWALFNISEGHADVLDMWVEWSSKSLSFEEGVCEREWALMHLGNMTIGTLLRFAKKDSPEEYELWKSQNIDHLIRQSLYEPRPKEWDIARVFVKMFGDRFICADSSSNIWYEFKDHRWRLIDNGVALKKLLVNEVMKRYMDYRAKLAEESKRAQGEDQERMENHIKKCCAVISALKGPSFLEKVIKMAQLDLHNPNFLKKINEDKQVWGCENGVLDFGTLTFRDGREDDYCTYSCGLEYHEFSPKDDIVQEFDGIFEKIYPNPKVRDYFFTSTSATMEGGNINKNFLAHTGKGNAGKSFTFRTLERTFGDYCIKFPRQLIVCGKGDSSGSARPELARVRGRRLAVIQELAKTDKLNIGILKELTGNDSFFSRSVYEKGTEIVPMFTLMVQTNEMPEIPAHDEPTWDRTRVVPYESQFVKPKDRYKYPVNSDPEIQMKERRFLADLRLDSRIHEFAEVMLWKLFSTYKQYKRSGSILVEPEEVIRATQNYRTENDVYAQFVNEKTRKAPTTKDKISYVTLTYIYAVFKEWYAENYPSYSKDKIGRNTLKTHLIKQLGSLDPSSKTERWVGHEIIDSFDSEGGTEGGVGTNNE